MGITASPRPAGKLLPACCVAAARNEFAVALGAPLPKAIATMPIQEVARAINRHALRPCILPRSIDRRTPTNRLLVALRTCGYEFALAPGFSPPSTPCRCLTPPRNRKPL